MELQQETKYNEKRGFRTVEVSNFLFWIDWTLQDFKVGHSGHVRTEKRFAWRLERSV